MVIRNLWRRGMRSLLTILGIATGVAAVVALGAIAQGIATNYGSALGVENDLLVTQANTFDVVYSSLDQELAERIRGVPDVAQVEPGVFAWVAVGNMPYFLLYGYEPGSVAAGHYRVVEGKPVTAGGQIVLGRRAADSLSLGVDDTLRLNGIPFRITGIYETGQGMEESGAVLTLDDAQTIAQKQRKVSLFQVALRRGANVEQVTARIQALDDELNVTESSNRESNEQWTDYLTGFAWGIAGIAVLVGGLGMMSAMVMTVLERTREIGTLRALGWTRRRVVRLILGEAFGLSVVGGVLGVLFGTLLAWAAGQIPGAGAMLQGNVSPAIMLQGMVTAILLGLVGGLYPAWTAANLSPVEALRYEGGSTGAPSGRWARLGSQGFRNLWRRRTRTFISATGIGVGVAALVMMGGLIDGVIEQFNGLAGAGGLGSITVMQRDVADMSLSSVDERVGRAILAMPEVESITPFMFGVVTSKEFPMLLIGGIDPNSPAMRHYKVMEGRAMQRPNEIMVGKSAAETYTLAVGDTVQILDARYKVTGIFETGVSYEDSSFGIALREAQRMFGRPRTATFIYVDVRDPAQAEAVAAAINRRFPEARASMSSEFIQSTNDIQTTMAMTGAVRMLALLVGGIVVANTMIMSIFERTREIGTLRALGWGPRRIVGQVIEESLYLCLVSAAIGSLLGVFFMWAITQIPYFGDMLSAQWNPRTFITAIGVSLALGLLGGILPAWRASRLQPVEALRYE
jgi:ABC-type antimicrobial peptide transport system permease subunit